MTETAKAFPRWGHLSDVTWQTGTRDAKTADLLGQRTLAESYRAHREMGLLSLFEFSPETLTDAISAGVHALGGGRGLTSGQVVALGAYLTVADIEGEYAEALDDALATDAEGEEFRAMVRPIERRRAARLGALSRAMRIRVADWL